MLAKAVAHHTTASFIRVVGSEFVQKYLGEGPRMVRDVFRLAKGRFSNSLSDWFKGSSLKWTVIVLMGETGRSIVPAPSTFSSRDRPLYLTHRFSILGFDWMKSLSNQSQFENFFTENSPSIIFIDEIDAIATKRFDAQTGADREVQRILLELLNQMDGFDQSVNVKVIMATNRQDTLDPALLRPGRLDRKIEFPLPDRRQKV